MKYRRTVVVLTAQIEVLRPDEWRPHGSALDEIMNHSMNDIRLRSVCGIGHEQIRLLSSELKEANDYTLVEMLEP